MTLVYHFAMILCSGKCRCLIDIVSDREIFNLRISFSSTSTSEKTRSTKTLRRVVVVAGCLFTIVTVALIIYALFRNNNSSYQTRQNNPTETNTQNVTPSQSPTQKVIFNDSNTDTCSTKYCIEAGMCRSVDSSD